jgi:Pentapeptide repeats (9 copies)/Pentapeptide repeats (8 copies)
MSRILFVGPVFAVLLLASTVQANGSSSRSDAGHPQPNPVQIEEKAAPTKGHPQLQHKGRLVKNIKDNAAAIPTIVAAIFAIASFGINYLTTVRNQQDTQFYEALKRFGDNDSPSVRFSAAGLLSVMACRHKRYFKTAFFQLNAGQSFEENSVVLEDLGENLVELYRHNPRWCLERLLAYNAHLRASFSRALASLCILRGAKIAEPISEELLREAESLSIYSRLFKEAISEIVEHSTFPFLQIAAKLAGLPQEERERRMSGVAKDLADYTKRLTANIDQINFAVMIFDSVYGRIEYMARRISKRKAKVLIEDCFLPTAVFSYLGFKTRLNFRNSELQYANFERAELDKSTFYDCKLDSAKFCHASLRGTYFAGVCLDGADLKWADLSGAELFSCSLRGADLIDTKLDGAELRNVDVLNAKFDWLNRDALRKCKWWESETSELVLQDLYDQYQMNPKAFTYQLPKDFSMGKRISEERWGEGPPRFQ